MSLLDIFLSKIHLKVMNFLGKYPKKFKMLGKYLFGIKFYLENYAFGFLSVWEKMFWKKIHLGKYPTAN